MYPLYHEIDNHFELFTKENNSLPPHLHEYAECIYVTEGTLKIGIGCEWLRMKQHDFAIIFPDVIHQFQIENSSPSRALYLLASCALAGSFAKTLQKYSPILPVINAKEVHPDIIYALDTLLHSTECAYPDDIHQAFFQIILARALPHYKLVEKDSAGYSDLTCKTVSYLSSHFTEELSLTNLAHELGASPYALSRIFSGVLHTNFNQYLNEIRLDHACRLLRSTNEPITAVYECCGFTSQSTFNRAFHARYQLSPREYRRQSGVMENSQKHIPRTLLHPSTKEPAPSQDVSWKLIKGRFL